MATPSLFPPTPARKDNLAILYQGVLTAIVRIQSGKQPLQDAIAFGRRIKDVLSEVDREAQKVGYRAEDIADATYVVVAFLDEVILASNDPARHQWISLQAEMYGRAEAGEAVFDRLNALRRRGDSARLADIFEVYYLCLLLGYKGRYIVGPSADLAVIVDELQVRIDHVRGEIQRLSPEPLPEASVAPTSQPPDRSRSFILAGTGSLATILLAWILFRVFLSVQAGDVLGS